MAEHKDASVTIRRPDGHTDRIRLVGITGFGYHGVLPQERQLGQKFIVDVTCELDLDEAARTDDLTKTVDYGALAKAVVHDIERDPVDLIETLADRIARTVLGHSPVRAVDITVHKPQAPIPVPVTDVAVTMTRSR